MQAQIMFGDPAYFANIPFQQWLPGDDETLFILLNDAAVSSEAIDILRQRVACEPIVFRLHNSQNCEIKQRQREAIRQIWPHAEELDRQFSHIATDPVCAEVLTLRNSQTQGQTIRSIVKGALKEVVLKALDETAVYYQLQRLADESLNSKIDTARKQSKDRLLQLLEANPHRNILSETFKTGNEVLPALASIAIDYIE